MRRWLWPYAMLVVVLLMVGLITLAFMIMGTGTARAAAELEATYAVTVEPTMRLLISILDMVAPFEVPQWFKNLYAVLAMVAIGGLMLSMVVGVLLLPVFYALYRDAED